MCKQRVFWKKERNTKRLSMNTYSYESISIGFMFLMPINRIIKIRRFILIITADFYCRLNSALGWMQIRMKQCQNSLQSIKTMKSKTKRDDKVRIDLTIDYKNEAVSITYWIWLNVSEIVGGARSFTMHKHRIKHTVCKCANYYMLFCSFVYIKWWIYMGGAVWVCSRFLSNFPADAW